MHSGRAKKIKKMLRFQSVPEYQIKQASKQVKKAKYEKKKANVVKVLKTKQHKGEGIEDFKSRRKKVNDLKHIKEKGGF